MDYIVVNEYVQEDVVEFRVGERVDSDMLLTLEMERKFGRQVTVWEKKKT